MTHPGQYYVSNWFNFSFLWVEPKFMEQKVLSFLLILQVTRPKMSFQYLNLFLSLVSFFVSNDLSQLFLFVFNIRKLIISLFLSFVYHLRFQCLLVNDCLFIQFHLIIPYLDPVLIVLLLHLIYFHILNRPSFSHRLNQNYEIDYLQRMELQIEVV